MSSEKVLLTRISRKARKMLEQAGINTPEDIFPRFGLREFRARFPSFCKHDLFGLAATLRDNFGENNVHGGGWSKVEMQRVLKKSSEGYDDFPSNTDQGVINRFMHSATSGKHYKKPRWRRRL